MGDRSVRQCKERYLHYLSPAINKSDWTNEEDSLLFSSVARYGKKWKILEGFFPNRTEIDIRNRYNVIHRRISKVVRSDSIKSDIDITNTANIILNVKEIYSDIFKQHDRYHNKAKNKNIITDNDEYSDETTDSPNCSIDENPLNNGEPKNNIEIFEDFINKISDTTYDESKSNVPPTNLLSYFNGRVYDKLFINDSTFN